MAYVRYSEQNPDLFAPLTADQVWAIEQGLWPMAGSRVGTRTARM